MKRIALVLTLVLAIGILSTTPAHAFVRGDYDGAGSVDIGDAISILALLFQSPAPAPECADAADVNDDGAIDISDAIFLLGALFVSGSPPPPPPYPTAGIDPTPDALPPCAPAGVLPFVTIAQGTESGTDLFLQTAILDAASWSALWTVHSPAPLPPVDFASEMVIVVLGTYDASGISYTIDELEVVGDTLEVRYTAVYPGVFNPVPSQPHHMVRTVRTLATPVFIESSILLP